MIKIRIIGPEDIDYPAVTMSADGGYAPDVANDLRNLAVKTYIDLFGGDLYSVIEGGESGEIPAGDLSGGDDA